ELIDVKGMKAQGNRLSPNDVQKVILLTEEVDEQVVEEEKEEDTDELDIDSNEELPDKEITEEQEKEKPKFVSEFRQTKKVDLEITNPDDIDGQLGLF